MIGFAWPLSTQTGWGQVGFNMVIQMLRGGEIAPVLLEPPEDLAIHGLQLWTLLPLELERRARVAGVNGSGANWPFAVMHPLGNHFGSTGSRHRHRGRTNIGRMVFENTQLTPEDLKEAAAYDVFLTPSQWNADILISKGLKNVKMVHEGVDESCFFPAPRQGLCSGRFIIYSGGKLEFRKGQDILIAAFKIFNKRHPDALLVVNWQSFWPRLSAGISASQHVKAAPGLDASGRLALSDWLIAEGLPEDSFVDIGMVPHHLLAQVMREAHVAVFPNRAEGATNLVALECMAVGLPVILSANTGHLDLMKEENDTCLPLRYQVPVKKVSGIEGTEGWGESSVEEILEAMEKVYTDSSLGERISYGGVALSRQRSWRHQVKKTIDELFDFL